MGGPKDFSNEFPYSRNAGLFDTVSKPGPVAGDIRFFKNADINTNEEGIRPVRMAVLEKFERGRNGELTSSLVAKDPDELRNFLSQQPEGSSNAKEVKFAMEKLDFSIRTGQPLREAAIDNLEALRQPESLLPANAFTPPAP